MEQTFNNGEKPKMAKYEKFTTWTNYYEKMKHDKLDVEIEKLIVKTIDKKIEKFWRSKFWINYIDDCIKNTNKIRLHDKNYKLGFGYPIDIYKQFCEQNPTTFCSVEFFAKRYEQKTNVIYKKWLIEQRKQQMYNDFK